MADEIQLDALDKLVGCMNDCTAAIEALTAVEFWGSHPEHPADVWTWEAADGDTRLGYHHWLANKLLEDFYDSEANAELDRRATTVINGVLSEEDQSNERGFDHRVPGDPDRPVADPERVG